MKKDDYTPEETQSPKLIGYIFDQPPLLSPDVKLLFEGTNVMKEGDGAYAESPSFMVVVPNRANGAGGLYPRLL